MKAPAFTLIGFLLAACGSNPSGAGERSVDSGTADGAAPSRLDGSVVDSGVECFPCEGRWICGQNEAVHDVDIDLKPEIDGCYLSGLLGRNLLAPDGTVTRDGSVIGKATGTGARVSVTFLDGGLWLYCAAGGGCHP
jgi:hypothetical protein